MEPLDLGETARTRANKDTEHFRQSARSFWTLEVVGASVFALAGGYTGFVLMPPDLSPAQAFLWPTIGGAGGIIVGLALVFALVFSWHFIRAPYKQRDEARAALQAIPGSPTAPILAEPQLFFSNLFCGDFGHGGEGNFGDLDASKRFGYVTAIANAQSEMTITRIALMLDGQECPAVRWNAHEVGVGDYLCSFPVEIAQTIVAGRHEANIVAFAKGKSWKSPDFLVEVPSH